MDNNNVININPYSLASYYVEPFFNDIALSKATCFFVRRNEKIYLITNWHVVSGKDADTLTVLDQTYAAIPNKLRVFLPEKAGDDSLSFDSNTFIDIDLYNFDGQPLWYELKQSDRMIDVVAIPFEMDPGSLFLMPIDDAAEPFNERTAIEITSEVYVIGFPFGRIAGPIPIWKKASIASEPEFDIDEFPYIFADTATREGMSGSPVVFFKQRPASLISEKDNLFSRHFTKIVGVYSGRIGANNQHLGDAQLGRVWKANIIDKLIEVSKSIP